ncbi:repulsive guidance molecule A isoform X1 [Hyalella azteca]|uniref:Repulsive guidance molecule A isoform X1 n=1 Tax=Hyalella azteca TaxID=294128 RepID=A0A979FL73_HYAAZ|nr:repulsive guidance molecule A isoform X1 [Hyalella azteca]
MNFEGLCRGDINFHSNLKVINSLLARHECSQFGEDFDSLIEAFSLDPENPDSQDTGGLGPCHYKGELRPRAHCGLFGDPHLRTFKGEFVTCRVEGAWPLLDTPHLAVQVTNVVVGPQLQATATSKVTVIVRGSDACGSGKTYEASAEQLPSAFVDGTREGGVEASGAAAVWVQEVVPGQHVHVGVRVVNATVSIRKIQSRYLSVSVTVPESVLGEEQGQGLCITSCPASETLSSPTHEAMPQAKAQELCAQHNITDSFLDACVFDLVATGETFFRDSASAAQSELWSQDPQTAASTLRNCTQWPCTWPTSATESLGPLLAMVAVSVAAALLPLT